MATAGPSTVHSEGSPTKLSLLREKRTYSRKSSKQLTFEQPEGLFHEFNFFL